MSAFQHSVDNDVHMLEMDVHLTKDGQLVVTHDSTSKKLTGVKLKIADTNYDDFPPI